MQSNNYAKQKPEKNKETKQTEIKKGKPKGLPIKPTHEAVEEEGGRSHKH